MVAIVERIGRDGFNLDELKAEPEEFLDSLNINQLVEIAKVDKEKG
jgi:hypothetical protein